MDYILGQPEIAGTGCQESTIHITPDGKGVEIDFEQLTVKAGGGHKSLARVNCLAAVPISVPNGYKVAVLPATFKGKHLLQKGATLKAKTETFLAGQTGMETSVELLGKDRGTFTLGTKEFKQASLSKCGGDATLRLNLRLFLKSTNKEQTSAGKITGLKEGQKSVFNLKFIKC